MLVTSCSILTEQWLAFHSFNCHQRAHPVVMGIAVILFQKGQIIALYQANKTTKETAETTKIGLTVQCIMKTWKASSQPLCSRRKCVWMQILKVCYQLCSWIKPLKSKANWNKKKGNLQVARKHKDWIPEQLIHIYSSDERVRLRRATCHDVSTV